MILPVTPSVPPTVALLERPSVDAEIPPLCVVAPVKIEVLVTENVPPTEALLERPSVVPVIPPLCVVAPVKVEVLDAKTLPKDPVAAVIVDEGEATPPTAIAQAAAPTNNEVAVPARLSVVTDPVRRLKVAAEDVKSPPLTPRSPVIVSVSVVLL